MGLRLCAGDSINGDVQNGSRHVSVREGRIYLPSKLFDGGRASSSRAQRVGLHPRTGSIIFDGGRASSSRAQYAGLGLPNPGRPWGLGTGLSFPYGFCAEEGPTALLRCDTGYRSLQPA